MIVAINKMDKPTANPDKVKQELTEHGLIAEDWGWRYTYVFQYQLTQKKVLIHC